MRRIALTKGQFALVDDEDYELLSKHNWWCGKGWRSRHYANRESIVDGKRRNIYMHRVVNSTPDGFYTDHINGNTLDNRRKNLRTVTTAQNSMNTAVSRANKSGYKGVSWHKQAGKWAAYIKANGDKRVSLGLHHDIKEAALAYNKAAKELCGKYARLNRIEQ